MNCYYCNEPCQLLDTNTDSSPTRREADRWSCKRHAHEVIFISLSDTLRCTYRLKCKENNYLMEWYKDETQEAWWIICEESAEVLVQTQYIPQRFTPETIDKKLPLLLPFL